MIAALAGAAVAGVVGTPHCAGMCGGFAASNRDDQSLLAWHAGRLAAYAALGALSAKIGASIPGPSWLPVAIGAAFTVYLAATIAGVVAPLHFRVPGLAKAAAFAARHDSAWARLLFGALTALLPCGLLWSVLATPMIAGSPAQGAAMLLVFGLGTVPGLSIGAFGARKLMTSRPWMRTAAAAAVVAIGLHAVWVRASMDPAVPTCHHAHP